MEGDRIVDSGVRETSNKLFIDNPVALQLEFAIETELSNLSSHGILTVLHDSGSLSLLKLLNR